MVKVQGTCDSQFQHVRELFQGFLDSGVEVGASVAVNVDGRDVVDLWGGHVDSERTAPWDENTIVNVFSLTKNVTSLAVLLLVNDRVLSIYDKVSKYWPEFAANGKGDVEVRHLLSHTSGVAGWEEPITVNELYNVEESTAKLARQAPWWEPGTASGYHMLSFGNLNGEIVRRVSGLSLKDFVAKRIAEPLDADFQIGAAERDWPRISNVIPPPQGMPSPEPGSILAKVMNPPPVAGTACTPEWRKAEIGGGNGHGNARAFVRIFSNLTLAGKDDGKERLISKETADLIFEEQYRGVDLALGQSVRFGVGYGLRGDGDTFIDEWLPTGRICTWGGWGGSRLVMDFDRRVTLAYTMNKMANEGATEVSKAYVKAVYDALGVEVGTN